MISAATASALNVMAGRFNMIARSTTANMMNARWVAIDMPGTTRYPHAVANATPAAMDLIRHVRDTIGVTARNKRTASKQAQ